MDLLRPGQIFVGRYRVERALAQGGMGAVFIGEQLATEMPVAIKVLFPQVLSSRDAVEKFQFEAKVAARVKSDHIVKVLDAGYDDESGLPFLVMELLDGQELDAVVQSNGPLPALTAADYVRQVALGLDKAHGYRNRRGEPEPIVHRDLKPENLFLARRESGAPMVKILDFGIAKVLSDTAKVSQEIKGTPLFMAYEQATGSALSPQTDIWALGLITFYLLTGRIYWRCASSPDAELAAIFAEVLNLPIDSPTDRIRQLGGQPTWGPEFDAWFLRCVHRDPSARFATAGDASRELARALGVEGQLRSTPATGSLGEASKFSTARTLAGDSVAGQTPPKLPTDGSLALSHTAAGVPSSSKKGIVAVIVGVLAVAVVGAVWVLQPSGTSEISAETEEASPDTPTEGEASTRGSDSSPTSGASTASRADPASPTPVAVVPSAGTPTSAMGGESSIAVQQPAPHPPAPTPRVPPPTRTNAPAPSKATSGSATPRQGATKPATAKPGTPSQGKSSDPYGER